MMIKKMHTPIAFPAVMSMTTYKSLTNSAEEFIFSSIELLLSFLIISMHNLYLISGVNGGCFIPIPYYICKYDHNYNTNADSYLFFVGESCEEIDLESSKTESSIQNGYGLKNSERGCKSIVVYYFMLSGWLNMCL